MHIITGNACRTRVSNGSPFPVPTPADASGQLYRMAALGAQLKPSLGQAGALLELADVPSSQMINGFATTVVERRLFGGTWTTPLNGDLSVAGALVIDDGVTFAGQPERRISVTGTMHASGATFTAAVHAQGWRGIRFLEGSVGVLENSIVERVTGNLNSSVYAYKADVTLDNTKIQLGNELNTSTKGLYVTGPGAVALVDDGSVIEEHGADGVVATNGAEVLIRNSIVQNTARGVWSGFADVRVHDSVIQGVSASGYGARSYYFGQIVLNEKGAPTPVQNNIIRQNVTGDLNAGYYSILEGGSLSAAGNNNIFRDGFGVHAYAYSSSHIQAQYNWWGSASGPDPSFVVQDPSSVVTYCPWLVSEGGPPVGTCFGSAEEKNGGMAVGQSLGGNSIDPRVGERADPLDDAREALRRGDVEGATRMAGGVLRTSTEARVRERAMALITGIRRQERGSPSADQIHALLLSHTAVGQEMRPLALRALVADALSAGASDVALTHARALATHGEATASVGEALMALAYAQAGRFPEGQDALVRAVALAPEAGTPDEAVELITFALEASGLQLEPEDLRSFERTALRFRKNDSDLGGSGGEPSHMTEMTVAPNPTSGTGGVEVRLSSHADVEISIYDVLGRRVRQVASGSYASGLHRFNLSTGALAEGVYVLRAVLTTEAGSPSQTLTRVVSVVR